MEKYYICLSSEETIYSRISENSDLFSIVKSVQCDDYKITVFEFDGSGVEFLKEHIATDKDIQQFFDSKGSVYTAINGEITKSDYKKKYTLRRIKKSVRKSMRIRKFSSYIQKKDKKQTGKLDRDTILKNGNALWYPSFKRLKFYNHSDGKCHRFRLHVPKSKKNNELIVYLHGAGAPGYDNFQQIWESQFIYNHLRKAKKDCFILAPQLGYIDSYNTDEHSEMLWNMINAVNKKYGKIDFSRIYLIGVSYGGYGTVYECFRHPERYAAAIPTVGWTYLEGETQVSYYKYGEDKYHLPFNGEGISELAKTPMWLACSHIEARHVETLYGRLKDINADVRLTRNDKHGHKMGIYFFRNQPWEKWLFDKTKSAE